MSIPETETEKVKNWLWKKIVHWPEKSQIDLASAILGKVSSARQYLKDLD